VKNLVPFSMFMASLVVSSALTFLVMYFFGLIFFLTVDYASFPEYYRVLCNILVVLIGLSFSINESICSQE